MTASRVGAPQVHRRRGAPVVAPETPPYAQFWPVPYLVGTLPDTRAKYEALALASFRDSLTRQGRRAADEPEVSWLPMRRTTRVKDLTATPLVTDLRACLPGEAPEWWLLTAHARTLPRGPR